MYFKSRSEAGDMLADRLEKYRDLNTAVIALTPGAALIGAQVAKRLHSALMLLLTENITLPGEGVPLAAVTSENTFTYNNMFSTGQIEEMESEYLTFIEGQRLQGLHYLHALLGHGGEINRDLLRRHVVILVSDGLNNGFSLDVAADFLKPTKLQKLVIVTPVASVSAVDRMHLVGDEIICLSVVDNYIATDHYYDENTIPSDEDLLDLISKLAVHWDP